MGRRNRGKEGGANKRKINNTRRKNGNNSNENEENSLLEGGDVIEIDLLPDDHTVAETVATFENNDDYSYFECDNNDNSNEEEIDDLISSTGKNVDGDRAAAMVINRHARCIDVMNSIEDSLLTEKRSAKREAGLRRLFRAISQLGTSSAMMAPYQNVLTNLCINQCLRGGSPAEQYAACRVLEVYSVILGSDGEDFYETIHTPLCRVVGMAGRATSVRNAALRALCLSNFIGTEDDVSTESLLDLCEEVAQERYRNHDVPMALRATALECWSLLSTTINDFYISGSSEDHIGRGLVMLSPLLQDCLEENNDTSPELRSAAGECLAIIHEARVNLGETDGDNGTERRYGQGGWENTSWEETMDYLTHLIVQLSNQSGHYISKKVKKEQRATFREYVATVLENESPLRTIALAKSNSDSIMLSSWKEIVQLDFIRHCLQGGFQIQIMTNPTLQAIFSIPSIATNNSNDHYSQLEKRLLLSKNSEASKQAYIDRNKKRRVRNNIKNHFITTDGDDI